MADMEKSEAMEAMSNLNPEELDEVAGGKKSGSSNWQEAIVHGTRRYLGVRSEPVDRDEVEIGQAYNGDVILVQTNVKSGNYVWAAVGSKQGWVHSGFIQVIKRYR